MMTDKQEFSITGMPFVDGIIVSQIIGFITMNIQYILQGIYFILNYIYHYIYNFVVLTIIVDQRGSYLGAYLDLCLQDDESDNLYGCNFISINNAKDADASWFQKFVYSKIESIAFKDSISSSVSKKRIIFNGKTIWIKKTQGLMYGKHRDTFVQFTLTMFKYGVDKKFIEEFAKYIESKYNVVKDKTVITFEIFRTNSEQWEDYEHPGRLFETVYIKPSIKADIIADIELFRKSEEYYDNRSIPYQRGYLFHGPPGTGKTSIVKALATKYKYKIMLIKLSDKYITDSTLESILLDLQRQPGLFLFEDIDVIFNNDSSIIDKNNRDSDDDFGKKKGGQLTYSGFINILSGITNIFYGSIIIMTTNHLDRIPASMIRPGRIDKVFHIGYADRDQVEQLMRVFIPNISEGDYKLIPKMIVDKDSQLTIAIIQNYFIKYRTLDEIVANIDKIREI